MEIHMPFAGEGALLFIIFTKESLTPKGLVLYTSSSYKPGIGTLFSVKGQRVNIFSFTDQFLPQLLKSAVVAQKQFANPYG